MVPSEKQASEADEANTVQVSEKTTQSPKSMSAMGAYMVRDSRFEKRYVVLVG